MHPPRDQMTPKERLSAFAAGRPFDRIPCNLFMGEHAAKLVGAKVSDFHLDPKTLVAAQLAAVDVYGAEGIAVSVGLTGFAEALGSKVAFPEYGTPFIEEFALGSDEDLNRLRSPDPKSSGRFPLILAAAEELMARIGDSVPVTVGAIGPFSTASNLRGAERLLRDLRSNPAFVHRLLRRVTDATIDFVREAGKLGVRISIGDPVASGSLIGPKAFRTFALPYLKELVSAIVTATGSAPVLHICGDSKTIWKDMVETGASALSLDDSIDLREAKEAVGRDVTLVGNIRPTQTMYLGTPADVEANAKECLLKAYDSPRGYILSLGCGLPYDTPPANIHALMRAARVLGRYPLEPASFGTLD